MGNDSMLVAGGIKENKKSKNILVLFWERYTCETFQFT